MAGCPNQTRLASVFLEHVKLADFPATLEPLFHMWKVQGKKGEAFGDFSNRVVSGGGGGKRGRCGTRNRESVHIGIWLVYRVLICSI